MNTRARSGIRAFAHALLVIPKVLASNSGLDIEDTILNLLVASSKLSDGSAEHLVGIDLKSGQPMYPAQENTFDNYNVKKQMIDSW